MLEARQRSKEWRQTMEEYCPQGGALLGDDTRQEVCQIAEPRSSGNCPDHLNEVAKAEWNRISVEQKDTLTPADAPALAAYCAAYGRWADAESNIQKFGVVIKNKAENPIQNPYVAVAHQALDTMHKFLALLQHKQSDSNSVF